MAIDIVVVTWVCERELSWRIKFLNFCAQNLQDSFDFLSRDSDAIYYVAHSYIRVIGVREGCTLLCMVKLINAFNEWTSSAHDSVVDQDESVACGRIDSG